MFFHAKPCVRMKHSQYIGGKESWKVWDNGSVDKGETSSGTILKSLSGDDAKVKKGLQKFSYQERFKGMHIRGNYVFIFAEKWPGKHKQLAPQRGRAAWGQESSETSSRGLSWESQFSVVVCILNWIHESLGPEKGISPRDMRKEGEIAYGSYSHLPQTLSSRAVSVGCVGNTLTSHSTGLKKCPVESLNFWLLLKVCLLQELSLSFLDVRLHGFLLRPLLEYCLCEWSF